MRSERVFLMELFLEEKLPKEIKIMIKNRFQELEDVPARQITLTASQVGPSSDVVAAQSPSMQRMMMQNPDLVPKIAAPVTPAAAQALAARHALLNQGEKPEKGRSSPRKA